MEQYGFRKLEELNLIDNYLFGSIVTHPEEGERFSRYLLEIVFGRKFGALTVVPQKVLYGSDTEYHGARLDVYLEETPDMEGAAATIYDVEPEKGKAKKASLPQKVRFYHCKIGSKSLASGAAYDELKRVVILMIVPFDPFGLGRMVYTIKNHCVEEPEMPYEDGAVTIFLYTKGEKGEPREELHQMLRYFECSRTENASTEALREIDRIVRRVKQDEEVTIRYMRLMEDERDLRETERRIGREEGVKKGMEEGIEKGIISSIESLMKKLKMTAEQAMEALSIPQEEQTKYRKMINLQIANWKE